MPESDISVVIATHNGEKFIAHQIDSILSQTVPPREIIVSDDDSSDSTVALVDRYRTGSPVDISIHRNRPALGFADNFLSACALAKGPKIAFCDQDDVWYAQKLERCGHSFSDPTITMVVHQCDLIDEAGRKIGPFHQGITRTTTKDVMSNDIWGTYWGMSIVFRKDLLGVADPGHRFVDYIQPKRQIAHDRWVSFLGQVLGRVVEIAEPLAGYRQHGRNLFGSTGRKSGIARPSVSASNLVYRDATRRMMEIVEQIDPDVTARFPAFDRAVASEVIGRALSQIDLRASIYDAPTWRRGLRLLIDGVVKGTYHGAHNGRLRWKSVGKDLAYVLGVQSD